MHLSRFPRQYFAHLPTPIEPLDNLSNALGGPRIWMKRDDCTGLAGGGNKTRKLEFLMADALQQEADTIITQGAIQSNHARQTAAIAARLGFQCHILLEDRTDSKDPEYLYNGNVLLDQLFGASLQQYPGGTDMNAAMETVATKLRDQGKRPYIIPGGGSNEIGALGYVNAALELVHQANNQDLQIDGIVHATGSAGTQAGLLAGLAALNADIPVLGIGVRVPREQQEENVYRLAQRTADHLGFSQPLTRDIVKANCNYIGEGYGFPTPAVRAAILLLAQSESILLDPVYSGKGMAGLIDLVKQGEFSKVKNLVFIHTGGSQALFGYREMFGYADYLG